MLGRLGNVLYWLGCAGLVVGIGLAAIILADPGPDAAMWWPRYAGFGVGAFVLGRASRYVLAGR